MRIAVLNSLKYRISLIVFVLEVVLLTFVLTHTLSFIEKRATEDMTARHEVDFELIKSVTQDSLFAGEFEDLQTFIDKIAQDDEILNVIVVNDAGTIVANIDLNQVGATFQEFNHQLDDKQWVFEKIDGLGQIYVQFSRERQREHLAAAQELGVFIAVTGISIITVVSLFFGFLLTRRLKTLTNAVNQFHHDNQVVDVKFSGQDEIAQLGRSFNYMSSEINDYILKLRNEREQLEKRVLQRTQDLRATQEELLSINEKLTKLSVTDWLTGISNRGFMEEKLSQEIAMGNKGLRKFGVILIDIDEFKSINDTFGHDVGDYVITTVAEIVKSALTETDSLARWGGEEFLVLCSQATLEEVINLANAIRFAIRSHEFKDAGTVTASFGITMFMPGDKENELVKRADVALYQAKDAGRNCIKTQCKVG